MGSGMSMAMRINARMRRGSPTVGMPLVLGTVVVLGACSGSRAGVAPGPAPVPPPVAAGSGHVVDDHTGSGRVSDDPAYPYPPLSRALSASAVPHSEARASTGNASTAQSPAAIATPGPTAPLATPDEPVSVALDLETARREVQSWLDPQHDPVVEQSFYVWRPDLYDAWPSDFPDDWGPEYAGRKSFVDFVAGLSPPQIPLERKPGVLAVVLASTLGLGGSETDGFRDMSCAPVGANDREHVLGVFDAESGWLVAASPDAHPDLLNALARTASRTVQVVLPTWMPPTPYPWSGPPVAMAPTTDPTPRPTFPPDADAPIALATGQVPVALSQASTSIPLVPGAWWAYDVTTRWGGVSWNSGIVTHTIDAAWRVADDAMLVHTRTDAAYRHLSPLPGLPIGQSWDNLTWRYLTPHGELLHGSSLAEMRGTDQPERGPELLRMRLPLGESLQWLRRLEPVAEEFAVPAGEFDGCVTMAETMSAATQVERVFCPGVGDVRVLTPFCGGEYGGYSYVQLRDFRVPQVVLR